MCNITMATDTQLPGKPVAKPLDVRWVEVTVVVRSCLPDCGFV